MKKITFVSNYGNFATRLTAEIGEDVNAATTWLAETQGLGNIAYRVAGSKVDKAFGVKGKDAKFDKRVDVPFSGANQLIVETAVRSAIEELEKATPMVASLNLTFNVTGQHEFGATDNAPTKEATELWTKIQGLPKAEFDKKLVVLGLDGEYTDESAILAIRNKLREARQRAAEQAKNALM